MKNSCTQTFIYLYQRTFKMERLRRSILIRYWYLTLEDLNLQGFKLNNSKTEI